MRSAGLAAIFMQTMLLATGASAQMSALDIVNNARLQDLMRLCQRLAREELRMSPEQESNSAEFRAGYMECMRDQRASMRIGQ